jgi:hypothetical protein
MLSFLSRLFRGSKEAQSDVSPEDFAQNIQLICSTEFFVPYLRSKKKESKKSVQKAPVQKSEETEEKPLKRFFPWFF